jgi:hypothetical protein
MDTLTGFGLFAVTAMLATYALEERHRRFILAFAGGALWFGFIGSCEVLGRSVLLRALVAVRRWWMKGIAE